ncbi:prostaglandin E synthase 2-like isoform X2 [Olea europaea var. sylvestris]|uniref:prostaglandin E synthase 2-like isoform X2 n=1 Tax=Olea europaea var. sylvestris TaxID=158386 RepID=UPI000C1D80D1|nr:prostaglandin E synthase 2-like isoform X2 [Olea europaea var. sylvestris]
MRRAIGIAALYRAAGGVSSMPEVAGNHTHNNLPRIFHTAQFSTKSLNFSSRTLSLLSNKLADQSAGALARAIAGTMLFSFAATTLAEEVHAKEPVLAKFRPAEVVLYQYEACPFCNKVKAVLDYYDIPYKVVEVNPISKKEIKWSDYKKVPILMVDGEQMVDSSGGWTTIWYTCCHPIYIGVVLRPLSHSTISPVMVRFNVITIACNAARKLLLPI